MDFTRQITENRRLLLEDLLDRIREALIPFEQALDSFLAILFRSRLPADWRQKWHAFIAEQADAGFTVEPQSASELEAWIEQWAKFCELEPLTQVEPAAVAMPREEGPAINYWRQGPRTAAYSEQSFHHKLDQAQARLFEMSRVLETLGDALDAMGVGVELDVEPEVTKVEQLIWEYNDLLESARDEWLRENLSGEALNTLLRMQTPGALGLPTFTDDVQAERAMRQGLAISRRMGVRDVEMGRIIAGVKAVEIGTTVVGVVVGGGLIITTVKTKGKWAVVKLVAIAAAAAAAEQATEAGLRAAGASEQTIRGARLAAAIVGLIILRRRLNSGQAAPQLPKNKIQTAKPHKRMQRRVMSPERARQEVGNAFNHTQRPNYPYNEVPIAKPQGGKPFVLDSYDQIKGEIVFRRHTQFSEIKFKTAQAYFREFVNKYPPGSVIADVPSAQGLGGKTLEGKMIFEVPPQWKRIPANVLREAERRDIIIRDTNGRVYHAK
jgi:hypothetical protein